MANYQNILRQAHQAIADVADNADSWRAFLRSAAYTTHYAFPNQALIYSQRPGATMLADIDTWNRAAGRWVNRGARGVASLGTGHMAGNVRYLFDIKDTHPAGKGAKPLGWQITDANRYPTLQALQEKHNAESLPEIFGLQAALFVAEHGKQLDADLQNAVIGSTLEWAKPQEQTAIFANLITQSAVYMAAVRCGLGDSAVPQDAFADIDRFDTESAVLALGNAVNRAGRQMFAEIGAVVKSIDSMQASGSYLFLDPKGELVRSLGGFYESLGIPVTVIDLVHFKGHYNPMHYIDSDEDAVKLAYAIVNNTKPKDAPASGGDKFWDDASVLLISALILYLIYEAPVSEQNFSTLMYMIQNCQMEEGDMGPNPLEMLFNELQERDPLHPAVLQFNSFKLGSTKTLQSVLITASANLYMFNTAQFAEMTNTDTMFLPRLGLEKRVIFCVIPDNDKTYNFLITMLYTQLFDQLFRLADSEPKFDGALPVHVRFMMDEFANVALPANFKNILAVCRSRNISCDIILQSKSQIQSLYKDDWEGMIGNCDSLIYLGGNEYATFEWLSKYIGKMTERTKSQSIGRGSRGSSSDSYQLTARDLCSPDEIRRMDDGNCLVLLRSEPPVIDHKFDLMRHPNVKLTPDGGAAPYRMPDDYAQTAQTISPDVVTGLTEPAITDVIYEEIQKIMEEIHNEQERNL